MKYYLRSYSVDPETAELSAVHQNQYIKKNAKIKKQRQNPRKKSSKNKNKKRLNTNIKRRQSKLLANIKQVERIPVYDKILRFPIKQQKKTLRIYCYNQEDLNFQKRFCRNYIMHSYDDDQDSNSDIVQSQLERAKKTLFKGIKKFQQRNFINQSQQEQQYQQVQDQGQVSVQDQEQVSVQDQDQQQEQEIIQVKNKKKQIIKAKNRKNKSKTSILTSQK